MWWEAIGDEECTRALSVCCDTHICELSLGLSPGKISSPSPREFGQVCLALGQTQPEFTRRGGWGVRS